MSSYRNGQWKIFRQNVIQLDGYRCTQCGRGQDEVILQVHHKEYKHGCKAWEYATSDCITLCRGCHAQTHGIIQPTFGWEYISEEDLGDLVGTCENKGCGSSIRYSFTIYHQAWGTLEVGTVCCDNLTDTKLASNFKESQLKFEGRQLRFLNSKRWVSEKSSSKIKQGLFDIEVFENEMQFSLKVNGKTSSIKHASLATAKARVFEIIENGELMQFFKDIKYDFKEHEQERKHKRKKSNL